MSAGTRASKGSTPLLIEGARVLTMAGPPGPRRGPRAMNDLGVLPSADVLISDGVIQEVRPGGSSAALTLPPETSLLEARGRVLMPGFVDAHTHALWAGDRLDEWEAKRRGTPYLEILKAGGGIMSTVRAVRAASDEDLARGLAHRLGSMLRQGTTSVEVKSGYGLSTPHELRTLRVIERVARERRGAVPNVVMAALLGHALDPDVTPAEFVRTVIDQTLPTVAREFPGITIDAFCEDGAWMLGDAVRLFEAAIRAGLPFRVHTDQFTSLGMTRWAIDHGAASVDHLEATTSADVALVGGSGSAAVLLPCTGFHTDGRYAPGRALVDAGAQVVVATNCNPGSSPCSSMPMAIALAVRGCGLTPAEAIVASTANAAALLGLRDRGAVTPGCRADLVLLGAQDERELAHGFGGNPVDGVFLGGVRVEAEAAEGDW